MSLVDGNEKRFKKTEGGASTYYVYSSVIGSAVMEVNSSSVQRAYVMNGGSVVAQRNPDGNFYWLHADHLGSGRKMTNTSGNLTYRAEFDPYGKLSYEWSATPNQNTKKFTGYERDAGSGLDYAQARMYGSEWGRFLSPDPVGMESANKQSPKTFNRYNYVNGDPMNYRDSTGSIAETAGTGDAYGYWNVFESSGNLPLARLNGILAPIDLEPIDPLNLIDYDREHSPGLYALMKAFEEIGAGCKIFFGEGEIKRYLADIYAGLVTVGDYRDNGNVIPHTGGTLFGTSFKSYWDEKEKVAALLGQKGNTVARTVFINKDGTTGKSDAGLYRTIIVGSKYYRKDFEGQKVTMMHEFSHILTTLGDDELFDYWNLNKYGYKLDLRDATSGSQNITKFLANDCK